MVLSRRVLVELAAAAGASVLAGGGCSPGPSVVPIGGETVDAETIDKDPLALLPSGVVLFGALDLASLYATPIGGDFAAIVQSLVPIGAESGFVPARDTTRAYGGIYAMQGVDFCAVTQGTFDIAAIQRAADGRVAAPSGLPLLRNRYGDYDLYTVGNLGFVLLTSKTLLSGNETGMRRALDRLRTKRFARSVPGWMITLAETKDASFAVAGDFGAETVMTVGDGGTLKAEPSPTGSAAEPVLEAAAANFPFLSGMRALRVLGNFQAPGVNFAGSLTYGAADKANAGAESLRHLSDLAQWANLLTAFGFGATLPPARIAVQGNEVGFVQPVDTAMARVLLGIIAGYVKK